MRRALFVFFTACFAVTFAASAFLAVKVYERDRLLSEFVHETVAEGSGLPTEEVALRLSRAIFEKTKNPLTEDRLDWYSRLICKSFLNMGPVASLRYGGFGIENHSTVGPCGTMTRTLLNALWLLDIPARKLQILDNEYGKGGGHTMVEFQANGRWLVVSPSDSSFVWRKADGSIATAEEIQRDPQLFAQIYESHPRYPYLFDRYSNIRWEKLPPRLRALARTVLGEERYGTATTPRLYDRPRTLIFLASVCVTLLFGVLMYVARPRRRVRSAAD
jgi:hypothetical protein